MADRSYARYLAPLALVVFVLALIMVVTGSGSDPAPSASDEPAETQPATEESAEESAEDEGGSGEQRGPRRYRVEPGDTPSTIAEKTGVPLDRIEELNPDIDPQQLTPGQRIRLR